jgi:mitogen-activated protein kinase kinase kinase
MEDPTQTEVERGHGAGSAMRSGVVTWTPTDVCSWLHDNRCGGYESLFLGNDISGSVLLDVDQQALKEMGVHSVGDRMKITVAIKKLRASCRSEVGRRLGTASSTFSTLSGYSINGTNSSTVTPSSTINGARGPQRIPPPLSLSHSAARDARLPSLASAGATASANLSAHGSRLNSLSANSTTAGDRRGTSPRSNPPTAPAPRVGLPPPPPITTQQTPTRGNLNAPSISTTAASPVSSSPSPSRWGAVPTLSLSKAGQVAQSHRKTGSLSSASAFSPSHHPAHQLQQPRPSTSSGGYHHQPLSSHPYAASSSPTLDVFRPGSRGRENLSPITESPITPDGPRSASTGSTSSSSNAYQGFTVGRGGFARPSTPAGTVSVPAFGSYEDVMRKTVKFFMGDGADGAGGKTVSVEGTQSGREVLGRCAHA